MEIYRPKGSMCAVCRNVARSCCHLDFSKMNKSKRDNDGTWVVICSDFERYLRVSESKK